KIAATFTAVIPAKAGIQRLQSPAAVKPWIPAFAGMTSKTHGIAIDATTRSRAACRRCARVRTSRRRAS
ncbi:hypothetical protein, partial [Lysobacter sp. Root690]|uniref:hypothetical protein n=1 Tax=Lysobacter sp. Root690 TaxID=1736588 RepID=UPI001F396A0A